MRFVWGALLAVPQVREGGEVKGVEEEACLLFWKGKKEGGGQKRQKKNHSIHMFSPICLCALFLSIFLSTTCQFYSSPSQLAKNNLAHLHIYIFLFRSITASDFKICRTPHMPHCSLSLTI